MVHLKKLEMHGTNGIAPSISIDTSSPNRNTVYNSDSTPARSAAVDEAVSKSAIIGTATRTEPDSWLLRLFESDFFDSRLGS